MQFDERIVKSSVIKIKAILKDFDPCNWPEVPVFFFQFPQKLKKGMVKFAL